MGGTQQPHYQALYRACIKDAAAQGAGLMQAVLARAAGELRQAAATLDDVVERGLLLEACHVLGDQQQALVQAFPQALLAEFAHAIAGDRASPLSFESLALLGDEQLQDNADLVRACGALEEAVRPQLQALESTLAAAQLTPVGGTQRHPLRPEVYVRSIYRLARQSPVSPAVRRRWLRHLPALLAPELAGLYDAVAQRLHPDEGAGMAAPPVAREDLDRATQLTIRELRKLMAGEPARAADPTGPAGGGPAAFGETGFSHTVPAALQMVQDMRKVDQLLLQLRQRQAATPGRERDSVAAFRVALRQEARQPAQELGLEVVHLMIENLAADPRLLADVRAVVRELEPPLLRLALADPRFFSDRAHPGRQLLQEITQRSLAWSSPAEPGFAVFMDTLRQATDVLLDARASGPEAFEIALIALQDAWHEAQPRSRRNRERAVRALIRAEQRNLLAERLAREILQRPEAQGAPAEALAFLTGPWAQVLAQARLTDMAATEDPGGYVWVVGTVLWSVQPALAGRAAHQRALLVQRIRDGLASIDYLPADTQRWLDLLAALGDLALASATGSVLRRGAARDPERVSTWLAPLEMHESGFVPDGAIALAAPAPEPDTLPVQEVAVGAYLDLLGAAGWERWQLTWCSPHGMLFMFTHANGTTRSMTRARFNHLLAQGALRLVSAHPVVDGALDAVARAAWRNTH